MFDNLPFVISALSECSFESKSSTFLKPLFGYCFGSSKLRSLSKVLFEYTNEFSFFQIDSLN